MYGLPVNTDLNFVINQEFVQVCIGANELILNLSESCSITIMSDCVMFQGEKEFKIQHYAKNASLICSLIGEKIINYKIKSKDILIMKLSSDKSFVLYDDSNNYESFIIKFFDKEIVV